jgi:hypothetical protein
MAMAGQEMRGIEVAVSNPAELRSLRAWLERVPDVRVEQRAGTPGPGEQGAADVLMVLVGGSGVLAVAVQTLPEFLRSRRPGLSVTLKTEGKELTLTANNVEEVRPLIEKLLDG